MPAQAKPGVNWAQIEVEYRGGASFGSLERRHGVSRQGISKRAKKEGWAPDHEMEVLASSPTAERMQNPKTPGDYRVVANGQRTQLNMVRVLDAVRLGAPKDLAAKLIGMTGRGLDDWLCGDEVFRAQMEQAAAEKGMRVLARLDEAEERGDGATLRFMAERLPVLRDEFGPRDPKLPLGGGGVTVNLHLGGAAASLMQQRATMAAASVIDHEEYDATEEKTHG